MTAPRYGDEATFATVARIIDGIKTGAADPDVIGVARRVAQFGGAASSLELARGIRDFLASVWKYVDDPTEDDYPRPAALSLQQWAEGGNIWGDCDDLTVLGGALARAVNLPVVVTVLSFQSDPWMYTHVFASILTDDEQATSLDVMKPTTGPVPPVARSRSFIV